MYPVVFEIFGFPISSFGLMLAIAFLAGSSLFDQLVEVGEQ
jgi:prolipoprotein diacylglyceryltransferase